MSKHIVAIDQGTTSSRAIVFDDKLSVIAMAQREFPQHYPESGWVEHDAEDLWRTTLSTLNDAIAKAGLTPSQIITIGITNQRETTVVWDRKTGRPIHNAIVWQDRRTSTVCVQLKAEGHEPLFAARTGLLLDPYFSGTKIGWILEHVPGARKRAEAGELAFGTVDSFLLWRLTGGKVHATDATNASRTLLLDIHTGQWDAELCRILGVPMAMLPTVKDSAADFGDILPEFIGVAVPVRSMIGDQQAATVGQACFSPGMMKATYGTGCFALLNTGKTPVVSKNRLLTTIAYQLCGERTYALEGAIFVAGAVVQWLRDGLGLISNAAETGMLAANADPNHGLYFVPAFVGLGVPYWDAEARGAIYGLSRGSTRREIARAALESVGYQTADLIDAMKKDWQNQGQQTILRVDGGMVVSDWTMQFLADILGAPVDRPAVMETTALGAAYLAGYASGFLPSPAEFSKQWALERRFKPAMEDAVRASGRAGWSNAVSRTLSH
jgi:glycerol kinase